MFDQKFEVKTFGLPLWLACIVTAVAIIAAATGALSADLAGSFVLMLSIGFICNEIGERIPFWNSYIGGGLVLTFLVSAFLFTYNIIPQKYADAIGMVMDDADFLTFLSFSSSPAPSFLWTESCCSGPLPVISPPF